MMFRRETYNQPFCINGKHSLLRQYAAELHRARGKQQVNGTRMHIEISYCNICYETQLMAALRAFQVCSARSDCRLCFATVALRVYVRLALAARTSYLRTGFSAATTYSVTTRAPTSTNVTCIITTVKHNERYSVAVAVFVYHDKPPCRFLCHLNKRQNESRLLCHLRHLHFSTALLDGVYENSIAS